MREDERSDGPVRPVKPQLEFAILIRRQVQLCGVCALTDWLRRTRPGRAVLQWPSVLPRSWQTAGFHVQVGAATGTLSIAIGLRTPLTLRFMCRQVSVICF